MKSMKKIISMILSVMLIVSAISIQAFADNGKGNGKKSEYNNNMMSGFGKPLPEGKFFEDSWQVNWAQKAIDKLQLKGFLKGNNGVFQPNRSVTQLEAVIMSLRIMGWEDKALSAKELPKKYKGAGVQSWAWGYINEAFEKGILDDVDMMYFNPNAPIKRHEMAKYIIRALQKDDEAQDKMDAELPFVDAAAVPQGSVGYVYLVNDLGIMKGDDKKRFNPMGTLSRAEMAVLFYNLDEKVDGDYDADEFKGTVKDINSDKITIKTGTSENTFDVSEDVIVYEGTKKVRYSSIEKGDKVSLKADGDTVEYIEVLSSSDSGDKIITKYSGELKAIGDGDPVTLTVEIEDLTAIFKVADGAEFFFKGEKGKLSDLKTGDDVSIAVDNNNRAIKVDVDRKLDTPNVDEVEGTITGIDLEAVYHLSVDDDWYDLSKDADVEINGEDAELKDLKEGMDVRIELEDNVVVSIKAED